ncbi:P-II family nitrogen regulator [Arthrobacter mobilis]|uniref:P-II family nitrogen regulator n=1 Tax=Arthrobacter mobilis TaxID=2724944 RepID=A0A7X6H9V9_9MICC|nr:P-II family nitrogen regulator [Arthrobacter mobilis]NKX53156.1 P-II family nitrogen regulator [Arthrobacter mobilis]
MQLITAVIQPQKLEDVKTALKGLGVSGMTIAPVSGVGRQSGHTESYRGAAITVETVPKVRLDILATDEDVEWIINEIVAAARTGHIGDGKIWVVPATQVIRVSTGERGERAIRA